MKFFILFISFLVACELVTCSSRKQKRRENLAGNELMLKFLAVLGSSDSPPESRTKAYKEAKWIEGYKSDIIDLLDLETEADLLKAVADGIENIMSLYDAKKEKTEAENRILLELKQKSDFEHECEANMHIWRTKRATLLNRLIEFLKEAKTDDERVELFDQFLEKLKKSDRKLLLLGLDLKKLREDCAKSVSEIRKVLRSNELQVPLKKLVQKSFQKREQNEVSKAGAVLLKKRSRLLQNLYDAAERAKNAVQRKTIVADFMSSLKEGDKKLLLLGPNPTNAELSLLKDFYDFKPDDYEIKPKRISHQSNRSEPMHRKPTEHAQKEKLKRVPIFTSYLAISIYCLIGIIITIVVYFVFVKDTEEEVEL
jgi:hypothetical protein